MKKGLLLTLTLLLPTLLAANPVGREAAKKKALTFLNGRGDTQTRTSNPDKTLSLAAASEGYYIFNVSQQGGFVIVSSDDCAPDILGYADQGAIDPANMPDNMRAWLQGYADQIGWMRAHGVEAAQQPMTRADIRTPISPLLTSHWHQEAPYNSQTPTSGTKHCVTGCVATAVAQIMYYNKWPEATTTAIPQYTPSNSKYPTLLELEATTFDWSAMSDSYSATDDAPEVAKLMLYVGTAAKMNYGENASSTNDKKAVDAMKNYFGYTKATFLDRSCFTYSEWIDIIYSELADGRPVLYGGNSTGGGHAFVCDGYDEEDLFHINWGWDNGQDGYFRLSVLKPAAEGIGGSTTGDGYRMWQDIGVGLAKPDFTKTYPAGTATTPTLTATLSTTSLVSNQAQDITVTVKNLSTTETFHNDISLSLMNDTKTLQDLAGTTVDIEPGETKAITLTVNPSHVGTMPLAVFKGHGGSKTEIDRATVTITKGGAETSDNVALKFSVKINNQSADGKYILGNKAKLTLTVTNDENKNFRGFIGYNCNWATTSSSGYTASGKLATVPANSSITLDFDFDIKAFAETYATAYGIDGNTKYSFTGYRKGIEESSERVKDETSTTAQFQARPGLTYYTADGSVKYAEAVAAYTAPADAAAVDLRDQTVVTSVTPSANPNCLYLIGSTDTAPTGLTTNIVKGTTAASITLQDGYGLYTPIDFTATSISYTRQITTPYTVGSDNTSATGWTTICLPFTVSKVEAGGTEIDWFRSSSDTGKQFWLAQFSGDTESTVTFDYAPTLKAYSPYIIAVPGDQWGTAYDLTGKELTFSGTNATIKYSLKATISGANYKFAGTTRQQQLNGVWTLNSTGSAFAKGDATVDPFRAYFTTNTIDYASPQLAIVFGGGATAISSTAAGRRNTGIIYDLRGRRMGTSDQLGTLPKGIYIINGKKIIK